MEPTQSPRELTQERLRQLTTILDSADGAVNGRTKGDLAFELFREDTPETRHATTQLLARHRVQQLELGRMFVSFHRDGEWLNAAVADTDEGYEVSTRDVSRLQSAMNGLSRRMKFLAPRGLLTTVAIDALEADRRAIGTALLTPVVLPQIAAPTQQP